MTIESEQLRGEAREMYETWLRLGLSRTNAMRELERDGLVQLDGFGRAVRMFEAMGLSESAARTAAIGRDGSESAARQLYVASETDRQNDRLDTLLDEAKAALEQMSDAECRELVESSPKLRAMLRPPAANASPSPRASKAMRDLANAHRSLPGSGRGRRVVPLAEPRPKGSGRHPDDWYR